MGGGRKGGIGARRRVFLKRIAALGFLDGLEEGLNIRQARRVDGLVENLNGLDGAAVETLVGLCELDET